jgi:large subunit ribosomal protein L10
MQRKEKEKIVEEFTGMLSDATGIVLADFTGLNVSDMTQLRRLCRQEEVSFRVIKNTLAIRAAENAGVTDIIPVLTGTNAFALGKDPVAPAKVLVEFQKKNEFLKVKSGVVEGRLVDRSEIRRIASLPSRDELLSQVLAGFQGPTAGFARALSAMIRQVVTAMDEIRKTKEEAG